MRDFKYNDIYEDARIESILKERKHKIARQQVIFSAILLCILAVIGMYIIRHVVYTEFDGYLDTELNNIRAMEDLFIVDTYHDVGDAVMPGDTLFSYIHLSHFRGQENFNAEPGIIVHNRDMRVQYELARQDTEVLKVRIRELKRQLEIEDHNISFGLNDNVHKLELEKELAETEEELKSMQKKLRVLWNAAQETGDAIRKIELGGKMIGFEQIRQKKVMEELGIVRYSLAVDTAVITKIWVPELTTIMKGDPIIQSQSFDLQKSHLSVVGYIPVNKMNRITRNTQVEIFINKDISFTAHVALLGARTEIIPEHLRSNLSKDYAAIVANFRLDPGQILPFWVLVKNVPVTIRVNNFRKSEKRTVDYIYFNTSGSVITDSLNLTKRKP